MLGLHDPWIIGGYLLCILSTLLCVIYGIINWNKGEEEQIKEEDKKWAEEEDKIGEKL